MYVVVSGVIINVLVPMTLAINILGSIPLSFEFGRCVE